MAMTRKLRTPIQMGLFLLGNLSAFWGFVVLPIYLIGFGLLWPKAGPGAVASVLPMEPPLIGFALAALNVLFASRQEDRSRAPMPLALAGLTLNALALLLAASLWLARRLG